MNASIPSAQMLRVGQAKDRWKTLFASKTFLFWAFYSFMSLIVLGFDLTIPGQVLSMPSFNKQFGYNFHGTYVTRALYQSLWNGMTAIAQCIGALCSPWISNKFGRRASYAFSSVICIIGVGIQFASRGWQLLMVGKAINGFGLGGCFCFGPLYVGENAFPELRGFYLVFLNSSIVYGQLFQAFSAKWSQTLPGNAAWLTLFGLQWIFPVLTLALMPWYPESPYWILSKYNDLTRAKKELSRLYGRKKHHPHRSSFHRATSGSPSHAKHRESSHSLGYLQRAELVKNVSHLSLRVYSTGHRNQLHLRLHWILGFTDWYQKSIQHLHRCLRPRFCWKHNCLLYHRTYWP